MTDKYDEAIAYLTERPEEILEAWGGRTHPAGCLFDFATWSRRYGQHLGCLTLIRGGHLNAETLELTAAIRADERIPEDQEDITVDHLPVFAEWQRRLDKELGRPAP